MLAGVVFSDVSQVPGMQLMLTKYLCPVGFSFDLILVKFIVRTITFLNYISVPLVENHVLVNRLNIYFSY